MKPPCLRAIRYNYKGFTMPVHVVSVYANAHGDPRKAIDGNAPVIAVRGFAILVSPIGTRSFVIGA